MPAPVELTSEAAAPQAELRGRVLVWELDLDALATRARGWLARLGPAERCRAERLGAGAACDRYVARRTILRALLARHTGLADDPTALPIADDAVGSAAAVHYSVTQRDGNALLVLASRPIAIDLERIDAALSDLLPDALSESENEMLAALPPARRATAAALLLASKDAYLKARGAGPGIAPRQVVVALSAGDVPRLCSGVDGDDPEDWALVPLCIAADYVAVLAVPGGDDWRLERRRLGETSLP